MATALSLFLFCRNTRNLQEHNLRVKQEVCGHWACSKWVSKALLGYLSRFPSNTDQPETLRFLFLAPSGRPHSAHLINPATVQQVLLHQRQSWVTETYRVALLSFPTSKLWRCVPSWWSPNRSQIKAVWLSTATLGPRILYFMTLDSMEGTKRSICYQEIYPTKRYFWQVSINSLSLPILK